MNYKNFEELTYKEKLKFIEDQFNIAEPDVFDIEEAIAYCYNNGLLNNFVVKDYETVQIIRNGFISLSYVCWIRCL